MTWDYPAVSTLRAASTWPPSAHASEGAGPVRVVTDQADPEFRPRPVGFAPAARHRRDVEVDAPSAASSWLRPGKPGTLRIAPRPGAHRRLP